MDNYEILIFKDDDYTIKYKGIVYRFVYFGDNWYAFKTQYTEHLLDMPIFNCISDAINNFSELNANKILETLNEKYNHS